MVFEEFWPHYLRAHSDPRTRAMHVAGTLFGTALVLGAVVSRRSWLAGAGLVAGCVPAWLSHALIEGNSPEAFRAPISALRADFVMTWHVLRGTIDQEYAKLRI
jgi:hypothetical protein